MQIYCLYPHMQDTDEVATSQIPSMCLLYRD